MYPDRDEGLHGKMLICLFVDLVSQGEKREWQLWPGFSEYTHRCRWGWIVSLNTYMLITTLVKSETGSSSVI